MPSSSDKQKKFMQAVAHSPEFAKKVDVPQSVGKDFAKADLNRTAQQSINQPKTNHGGAALFKKGGDIVASKMNAGFMKMIAEKKAAAGKEPPMKKGGMATKKGGMAMKKAAPKKMMKSGGKTC